MSCLAKQKLRVKYGGEDNSLHVHEDYEHSGARGIYQFFLHTLCRITALRAKKERQQCAKCFPKYLLCPYNDCKLQQKDKLSVLLIYGIAFIP